MSQPARRIGFVLDDTLDKPDGVQQYVMTLGSRLSSQGHEVHYLVGESKRQDVEHMHSLARNVSVSFNKNRMSIPLPVDRRKLRQLLGELQLDVLHVQMPYSPMFAARVITASQPTTAVIGTFHILPFSRIESIATRMLSVWLKRSLSRFDHIVSVSEPARDFALESFGVKSEVLPNVIDMSVLRKPKKRRTDNDSVHIVYLGRLVSRKGCGYLLQALHELLLQQPQLKLSVTICGKGPDRERLERYVNSHGLAEVVTFAGFVDEQHKAACLASADIAVFPSVGGESFGIVLIEAMAAGAGVVVGGDNPGYRSVLGSEETLFDPRDITAFAELLGRLTADASLRAKIHKQQQSQVEAYDVKVVGQRLQAVYEQAIAKRRARTHNEAHG